VRRALLAAVLLVAATLAGALAPGLAAPASAGVVTGACTTSKGVTVVVNFGSLGGGTQVKCDTGATASTNGYTAMNAVGFSTRGTATDGPGFICRINDKPSPSQDPCIKTSPATAYWSYWHATNGGSWTYSSQGAMSHQVIVGGFEGWSFGDGSTHPTSGSPTRPNPPPQVQPTVKLGPAASTTTTRNSTKPSSSKSSSRTTSATSKATATQGSPTSTSSTGASPLAASTSADSAGGALASDEQDNGGSSWPIFAAVGVIGAILAASLIVGLRRRGAGGF
jgi:hypothetical protein